MGSLPTRVALIYDRVNKWGGAERVLLTLLELFPEADLFTSVYQPQSAAWARGFKRVIPSFLQTFPLARTRHELFPWLAPLAFETFDLSGYDLVISVTSAEAKGVITSPKTLHICYCLTPTRYLWSHQDHYQSQVPRLLKFLFTYLKNWDLIASARPDVYIAISDLVKHRLRRYYQVDSQVVYPPVDTSFCTPPLSNIERKHYLWVGRFVSYKQPLEVIQVFNQLNLPLVMVGTGHLLSAAKRLAKSNITFTGTISDSQLKQYYASAKALVMFHQEDFGLVGLEAMCAGTPVITQSASGIAELITPATGLVIPPSSSHLVDTIGSFEQNSWNYHKIQQHAQKYSSERFKQNFAKVITQAWTHFNNISTS